MKYALIQKITIGLLLVCSLGLVYGQKGKNPPANEPVKQPGSNVERSYKTMYADALKFGDFAVATNAVYGLLSLHPDSSALLDTLAALYFQRGAWPQVVLVTTEIL